MFVESDSQNTQSQDTTEQNTEIGSQYSQDNSNCVLIIQLIYLQAFQYNALTKTFTVLTESFIYFYYIAT